MEKCSADLQGCLECELCAAARYRRFVSLVAIRGNGGLGSFKDHLVVNMRNSDRIFEFGGDAIVLMTETSKEGAQTAVERYKAAMSHFSVAAKLSYGTATYPADGGNPDQMIAIAQSQL